MFYIKILLSFVLAFIDWKVLDYLRYSATKINEEEKFHLFIGTCILLAAFVVGGNN